MKRENNQEKSRINKEQRTAYKRALLDEIDKRDASATISVTPVLSPRGMTDGLAPQQPDAHVEPATIPPPPGMEEIIAVAQHHENRHGLNSPTATEPMVLHNGLLWPHVDASAEGMVPLAQYAVARCATTHNVLFQESVANQMQSLAGLANIFREGMGNFTEGLGQLRADVEAIKSGQLIAAPPTQLAISAVRVESEQSISKKRATETGCKPEEIRQEIKDGVCPRREVDATTNSPDDPMNFGFGMESQEDEPAKIAQQARDATNSLAGQIVGGALNPTVITQIRDDGTSPKEDLDAFRRDAPRPPTPPQPESEEEDDGLGHQQAQCG